jgi:predicted aspartyl protease
MRRRLQLLTPIAAIIAAPAGAQTATAVFDAISLRSTSGSTQAETGTSIKFRDDAHQRMTVPVRLAESGPYRFLVDTGADRTSISRDLVEALKLGAGRAAQLHTVTGSTPVSTAKIEELQFSAEPIASLEAPVLERNNIGADGILALDSLRSQRIEFDFRKNRMSVLPSPRRHYHDEPGTIVVRARQRNGRLVLSSARADGLALTVVIDTGSELTIGNAALKKKLENDRLRTPSTVQLQSVTGQFLPGEYTFLRRLEFGGAGLKNLAIVFADAHTFKQLGLEDKPAILLGMNALRAFDVVSIDFAQKKLRVMVPDSKNFIDGSYSSPRD